MAVSLLIDQSDKLEELLARPRQRDFELRLAALPAERAEEWARTLRRHYRACGCSEGAAFLVAAMAAPLLATLFAWLGFMQITWTWTSVLICTAAVIAAPFAGKAYGLFMAHHRLQEAIRRLQEELRQLNAGNFRSVVGPSQRPRPGFSRTPRASQRSPEL